MTMTKLKIEYKKCTHAKFGSKKKKKTCLVKTHFAMAFQTWQGGSANPHIPRNGPRASHWHSCRLRLTKRPTDLAGIYTFFSTPNPQLYPCSAQKRCNARETIQYNLQGAHFVLTNHKPKPLQLRCKEGINAENVCILQCARWSGHQWETNECQTLSTQPTHLTCFCSLTSGFYRWAARRRLAKVNWLCISALFCTTSSRQQ